jgi:hypothetical protein
MTRIIPKRTEQVKEPDQETSIRASDELKTKPKSKSSWSLDEMFNAKDITPSKNWKWSGNTFTNEKKE